MKLSPESYKVLRDAMAPFAMMMAPHREAIRASGKFSDLNKRVRWDWYWAAFKSGNLAEWQRDAYAKEGLNDDHLDTALRKLAATLEPKAGECIVLGASNVTAMMHGVSRFTLGAGNRLTLHYADGSEESAGFPLGSVIGPLVRYWHYQQGGPAADEPNTFELVSAVQSQRPQAVSA